MTRSNELRLALAEALGESPAAIAATNPRWLRLMREGVLVRLHIEWTATRMHEYCTQVT